MLITQRAPMELGASQKYTPRPKIHTPQIPSEMALELVSGADFWCKLMSGERPVDLRGSRGRCSA